MRDPVQDRRGAPVARHAHRCLSVGHDGDDVFLAHAGRTGENIRTQRVQSFSKRGIGREIKGPVLELRFIDAGAKLRARFVCDHQLKYHPERGREVTGERQRRIARVLQVFAAAQQLAPVFRGLVPAGLLQLLHVIIHGGKSCALRDADQLPIVGVGIQIRLRDVLADVAPGQVHDIALIAERLPHVVVVDLRDVGKIVHGCTSRDKVRCARAHTDRFHVDPRVLLFKPGLHHVPCVAPVRLDDIRFHDDHFFVGRFRLIRLCLPGLCVRRRRRCAACRHADNQQSG